MWSYDPPRILRPEHTRLRKVQPGLDLPCWFLDSIKGIDSNLYFVFQKYKTMYEHIMNQYEGEIEDPRFTIHGTDAREEIWGYPVKQATSEDPVLEPKWHLYRLCWPHGWAHVTVVEIVEENYLKALVKRLRLQATISDRYSPKEYVKMSMEERQKVQEARQSSADDLFDAVQEENKWLMRSAMDEMGRGNTAPTRPEKDVIMSGPWGGNRSKITRPITDREGGLVLPDEWGSQ